MTFNKLINYLKELFIEEIPNKKYIAKMEIILSKLEDKTLNLEAQMRNEKNESKRNNIELTLKVISKQQQKARRLMQKRELASSRNHEIISKPELSPRLNS